MNIRMKGYVGLILLYVILFSLGILNLVASDLQPGVDAKVVYNGDLNEASKILKKAEMLPAMLLEKYSAGIKAGSRGAALDAFSEELEGSPYLRNDLLPVLIIDPRPESKAPEKSKIYVIVYKLPEGVKVTRRIFFDKLPLILSAWDCNFSGQIKVSKDESLAFEITRENIDEYVVIPYSFQYETDLYWLFSNEELTYGYSLME